MRGDDFIRSTGNLAFVNWMLKFSVFGLTVAVVGLTVAVVVMTRKADEQKPLPIFIDRTTGVAEPVNWNVIDAAGEKRSPVEIEDFTRNLMGEMYTYNKFTVQTNMKKAFDLATVEAGGQMKAALNLGNRADILARNGQGLVDVQSVSIIESTPSIKVQVIFTKKVVDLDGNLVSSERALAVLKIKPIKRYATNAHGLAVIEYSENQYKGE